MAEQNIDVIANKNQLEVQSILWNHIIHYITSLSLKCAVELGIPDAIHSHGSPISLPDLLSSLHLPTSKSPHLHRLMRLLTHSGLFTCDHHENTYSLTPLSLLLTTTSSSSLTSLPLLAIHPAIIESFLSMAKWFRSSEPTAFSLSHGCGAWEYMAGRDHGLKELFDEAMAGDSRLFMDEFVRGCGSEVLQGVATLVDVGGGTGTMAMAIARAFPNVKCVALDLEHVVKKQESVGVATGVDFIAGDMFEYVPPADAVLLKSVLHNWSNKDCVKILKKCKEAVTANGNMKGKVIIIDIVLGTNKSLRHLERETQLLFDMMMMVQHAGKEREEEEWKKIFLEAGFINYKIITALGHRSLVELYP